MISLRGVAQLSRHVLRRVKMPEPTLANPVDPSTHFPSPLLWHRLSCGLAAIECSIQFPQPSQLTIVSIIITQGLVGLGRGRVGGGVALLWLIRDTHTQISPLVILSKVFVI